MIDLPYLEQKKQELLKELEQLKANANAVSGALQVVNHFIDVAKLKLADLAQKAEAEAKALEQKAKEEVSALKEKL